MALMKKTVFVSGIAGFLGSHIAEALAADGHRVVGCDNLFGGFIDNVPADADFHQWDLIRDSHRLASVLRNVDVVYHTAAAAYEGASVFSPHFVTQNIFGATTALLTAAISCGVKRFVFCSSMARYGTNELPFREDLPVLPQDPYGIAKVAAEMMIRNLCETHGIAYVIAVPHNILGPRQKYDDPYRNVAAIMMNLMLQGRQPVIYGDGEQRRCFTYIDDALEPLLKMGFADNVIGEVINIGPDTEFVSINELARIIAGLFGFDLSPLYLPPRPQEVRLANCSAAKARRLLGYQPGFTLEKGLARMADWMRQRGPRPFRYHLDLEIENDAVPATWRNHTF